MKKIIYLLIIIFSLNAFLIKNIKAATSGWINKISSGDGVVVGWAADLSDQNTSISVNFYTNGTATTNGTLMGSIYANALSWDVNNLVGSPIFGNHGFLFRIPDQWRDGNRHTLYAQPVNTLGEIGNPIGVGEYSFTLPVSSKITQAPVTNTRCLDPDSHCQSIGNDYMAPNYPNASGWGDNINYFDEWSCTSMTGINYIARLNIIPDGTHGPSYQKDSLSVNFINTSNSQGDPWIFFTAGSNDHGVKYSLKKAGYEASDSSWHIYTVLDNPFSEGGVSSQDGRGEYIVMNDYSIPGFGPASPIPGSVNKIPGVSNTSASANFPSYPLVGLGPLGITAITNLVKSSTRCGGIECRTCIHMNPKLLDYDADGVPHTLITNMWQDNYSHACELPLGAPITQLPASGNYLYRYRGPTLGWQLDIEAGLVTEAHNDTTNSLLITPKLLFGTQHSLIAALWNGIVETIDLDKPKTNNTTVMLDCTAADVHFGEGTGSQNNFYFLSTPPGDSSDAGGAFNVDIYYAFNSNLSPPAAPSGLSVR